AAMSQNAGAEELAGRVRAGSLTAAALVADALAAVDALDPVLHFMSESWADTALAAAGRIDALSPAERGALAGVPFLAKAGTTMRTPVVERLAAAGAIAIGTSTRPDPAAACQAWGWNGRDHTANPWRTDRSSGGSSAGAAGAGAAGVVPIATGADGAGSVRIPAAFCGVVGFKGSYGRVPRPAGRSRTQRIVTGVIGARIADVVLATSLASGLHPADPTALPHWPVPRLAGKVLGEQRPALMVAPFAADLQVAAGEALPFEAEALDQPDRAGVAGLDVRLDPVQAKLAEHRPEHRPQAPRHQALPGVRGKGAVAEGSRLQAAANDVVDVHHTDQAAAGPVPDQVAGLVVARDPFQVGSEELGGVRQAEPGSMQRLAGASRVDELGRVGGRRLGQGNVHTPQSAARGHASRHGTPAAILTRCGVSGIQAPGKGYRDRPFDDARPMRLAC